MREASASTRQTTWQASLGVVVIGRNEGARLVPCLDSLRQHDVFVVYVDSGSTDASVDNARARGAEVVTLDTSIGFTAARARNRGFKHLLEMRPETRLVQFVDGDCEVQPTWLPTAAAFLAAHTEVAAVCGRRRERHPDASLYNRLADMEWNTPVGQARACGGDVMVRAAALIAIGGYDDTLIAGEDPEMSLRLRRAGHGIVRLDEEMTLHDAALLRFSQWWRRNVRSGHAYAELAFLHGRGPERFQVKQVASISFWGGLLPVVGLGLLWPTAGWSAVALVAYLGLAWRIARHRRRRGDARDDAWRYALACVVGKLAELRGMLQFVWNRFARRQRSTLVEYKTVE